MRCESRLVALFAMNLALTQNQVAMGTCTTTDGTTMTHRDARRATQSTLAELTMS